MGIEIQSPRQPCLMHEHGGSFKSLLLKEFWKSVGQYLVQIHKKTRWLTSLDHSVCLLVILLQVKWITFILSAGFTVRDFERRLRDVDVGFLTIITAGDDYWILRHGRWCVGLLQFR